ncbi:MAG: hypothetical protein Q9208_001084 [Pyrenodesmia sp. 3 TL-2023]
MKDKESFFKELYDLDAPDNSEADVDSLAVTPSPSSVTIVKWEGNSLFKSNPFRKDRLSSFNDDRLASGTTDLSLA